MITGLIASVLPPWAMRRIQMPDTTCLLPCPERGSLTWFKPLEQGRLFYCPISDPSTLYNLASACPGWDKLKDKRMASSLGLYEDIISKPMAASSLLEV